MTNISIHFCAKRFAVIGDKPEIVDFTDTTFADLPKLIAEKLKLTKDDVVMLPTLSNAKYNAYGLAIQHFVMMMAEIVGCQCSLVRPMAGVVKQTLSKGYTGGTLNAKVDKALLAKLPADYPQDLAVARAYHLKKMNDEKS